MGNVLFYLATLCSVCQLSLQAPTGPQGYDDSKTYVHLVPHTHDDVGWLKTVDEYYYGSQQKIQRAAVQYILDTVVQELQADPNRTFIYVEMAFFTRWWKEQDDNTRNIVKDLVAKKQLEFINGGWCMNDEAATSYTDIIDQMTLGLQFIAETFGDDARPRVAWHIDPFGHSSTMASLLAQMGFQGFFFARIDHEDYAERTFMSNMEMIWTPSPLVGGVEGSIFTGVLYGGYWTPSGFCYDISCNDPPIRDDESLQDYNLDSVVEKFVMMVRDRRSHYKTNHVMLTMGSDFQYQNAHQVFKNLDKLIKYVNAMVPNMEVFYSSPTRYLDAITSNTSIKWSVNTNDFFPYSDAAESYWTGFYTSRPALKRYIRAMSNMLRTCKQLESFAALRGIKRKTSSSSDMLKKAMGVSQHHDAVTGTEMQHVADDYALRLHAGSKQCQSLTHDVLSSIMAAAAGVEELPIMVHCEYLNVSVCLVTQEATEFGVVAYNSLLVESPVFLWVPVLEPDVDSRWTVRGGTGANMTSQVQTVSLAIQNARGYRGSAKYELAFKDVLPPLGFKTYSVRQEKQSSINSVPPSVVSQEMPGVRDDQDFTIGTGMMQVTIDGMTGRVKGIRNTVSDVAIDMDQAFYWYQSVCGTSQNSGAYVFRPVGDTPAECVWNDRVHVNVLVKGDVYTEYRQQFNETIYQTIRVYPDLPYVEFDYMVGPLPVNDDVGKEVVSRFSTYLDTDGVWYTDSNGREMQRRVFNFRPTYHLKDDETAAQNYYPVTSKIFMKDEAKNIQFTVFTDRSQGGASLNDGQLELMVHRRLVCDDGKGVREPLSEPGQFGKGLIIRGRHYVMLDTIERSNTLHWLVGQRLAWQPYTAFMLTDTTSKAYVPPVANFTFLKQGGLPSNVHLLTFDLQSDGSFLLRLENIFDSGQSANVSLSSIFKISIQTVTELSLAANGKPPSDTMKWTSKGYTLDKPGMKPLRSNPVVGPDFYVELNPMEIRTFKVEFSQTVH